jgi:hypothetical protein
VGQAADALAGYHIPHAPIQPAKKDSRMALVSTSGKNVTEEEVAAFLRVLVSDTFAWEVKRHKGFEFKVLFPSKEDLTKMTKFNVEMKEGVTLKFQEFKEEEEYYGHALPVVWMRVTNLPTILREYVVLWALGTLFGVTQDVDMVTTRASNFGRFAVAVLEPAAIPNKLDVIIGNRYFQLKFEVEPFPLIIGLKNLWNLNIDGNEDQGNGAAKDTEMKEAQNNGATIVPNTNVGVTANNSSIGNGAKVPEAQMDYDRSNDDLLGEETELSESARNFVRVQKGEQVNVRNAATLASTTSAGAFSAPARMVQHISQSPRTPELSATLADGGTVIGGTFGQALQPALAVSAGAGERQEVFVEQQHTILEKVQLQMSVGQDDGAEGAHAEGAQQLGILRDAMLGAGVAADGGSEKELGSVMKMAFLSDGELTPVRRSKRNADVADAGSLEKAEKRIAVKNLEEPQGNLNDKSFCSFSKSRIVENLGGVGISLGDKDGLIIGSIDLLKNVENDRLESSFCSSENEIEIESEEDEIDPDTFTISRLCDDLTEEVMDDNSAGLDGVLVDVPIKVAKRKKKKKLLNKNTCAKKKIVFQ